MKIGFIGLGIMGKPMVRNLLKAGHEVWVNNRSKAPMEELAKDGAHAVSRQELTARRRGMSPPMPPRQGHRTFPVCRLPIPLWGTENLFTWRRFTTSKR